MSDLKENLSKGNYLELDLDRPWSNFYMVSPLIVVGSKGADGYNMAPKHMCTPLGFGPYYGFVCTPRHQTYHNIKDSGCFTISFPVPDQVVMTSLSAIPRCGERRNRSKIIKQLPTFKAQKVDALCLDGAYLIFECTLDQIIDGFKDYSLIIGEIIRVRVRKNYLISSEKDAQEVIFMNPLLAYLPDDRFAEISKTRTFPFPKDFSR